MATRSNAGRALACSTLDITQLPAGDTGSFLQRLNSPNMGLHVWLMTSRHTEPDLQTTHNSTSSAAAGCVLALPTAAGTPSTTAACMLRERNCCLRCMQPLHALTPHPPAHRHHSSTSTTKASAWRILKGKAGQMQPLLAHGGWGPYPHAGDNRTALLHVPICNPETHVWVVYLVHKAYGGRLVGVGLWQLNMQLPHPAIVRACSMSPTAPCMLQHESRLCGCKPPRQHAAARWPAADALGGSTARPNQLTVFGAPKLHIELADVVLHQLNLPI